MLTLDKLRKSNKMKFTRSHFALILILFSLFSMLSIQVAKTASAVASHTLTIQPSNSLSGQNLDLATITSVPSGINCGRGAMQCSAQFEEGSTVTLTASVQNTNDIAFQWHPIYSYFHASPNLSVPHLDCAGMDSNGNITGNTCSAPMPTSDTTIQFTAAYAHSPIVIKKGGSGTGTVSNQNPIKPPLLINCGTICSADISSSLILFAVPDSGSVFAGWDINGGSSADCGPTNYDSKCLASYQENVRGDGKTDTFIAVFNKTNKTISTSELNKNVPQPPIVDIKINGKLTPSTSALRLSRDDTIVLSGKTVVGGAVNIYTFSTPELASSIANKDGNWIYTLSLKDFAVGDHHIEADVTDPSSNRTSPRTQVLKFTLIPTQSTDVSDNTTTPSLFFALAALFVLTITSISVFFYIRNLKTKNKKKPYTRKRRKA